jgi:hypothetical protein
MDTITLGLLASACAVILLSLLFSYESRKGRFLAGPRMRLDYLVLRLFRRIHAGIQHIGKNLFRQILHFIFHTILRLLLTSMQRVESSIQGMMRVNRVLAKNAERENAEHSKLEEVALHKMETALSEEEKRAHKEKVLEGKM